MGIKQLKIITDTKILVSKNTLNKLMNIHYYKKNNNEK